MAVQRKRVRIGKEHLRRKRLFKAALAYSGDTLESWCRRKKLSTPYVTNVRNGAVVSPRILAQMDETIREFHAAVVAECGAEVAA